MWPLFRFQGTNLLLVFEKLKRCKEHSVINWPLKNVQIVSTGKNVNLPMDGKNFVTFANLNTRQNLVRNIGKLVTALTDPDVTFYMEKSMILIKKWWTWMLPSLVVILLTMNLRWAQLRGQSLQQICSISN